MKYYQNNYKKYIDSTMTLDMSELYKMFEAYLNPGDKILDVGFGSGRDMLHFQNNYETFGIDILEEFVNNAKIYGLNVKQESVLNIDYHEEFNGIWACASLLHVKRENIKRVFKKLNEALIEKGILYVSFKYGDFDGIRDGRYFDDFNETNIYEYIEDTGFTILKCKVTKDVRLEKAGEWLNLIMIKE